MAFGLFAFGGEAAEGAIWVLIILNIIFSIFSVLLNLDINRLNQLILIGDPSTEAIKGRLFQHVIEGFALLISFRLGFFIQILNLYPILAIFEVFRT